jgi:hypothetical protein
VLAVAVNTAALPDLFAFAVETRSTSSVLEILFSSLTRRGSLAFVS